MAATLLDQVTTLRRTPPTNNRDRADLYRNDQRENVERPTRSTWIDRTARRCGAPSFAGALVDIVPVLPMVGTIATVFAYVAGPRMLADQAHQLPLLVGGTITLVIGLITACLHRSFYTPAERAHPRSFSEIRQRLDGLAAQLNVLDGELAGGATSSQRYAFEEALTHYRSLEHDLAQGGQQWTVGTGYVDAMTRMHRAEEALIMAQPADAVLSGALFDELRIAGSTMVERDRLLARLRVAVEVFEPSAAVYLSVPDQRARRATDAQRATAAAGQPASVTVAAPPEETDHQNLSAQTEARIVLREIRRTVNDFRDESRARLIRSRARLLGTLTMTGVITYVLLAFAISLDGAPIALNNPIAAAAAIYLVGAVVGLFNRLYVESGDDAAGEDYGLSKTRLLLTPMLSGLAAVGGVLIVGMLSGIVDVNAVTPTPGVADLGSKAFELGPDAQITRVGLSLQDIFNLQKYPFALVLAAIFGLTPKTFVKRLQQAGEQSRIDLKSTNAHPSSSDSQDGKLAGDRA